MGETARATTEVLRDLKGAMTRFRADAGESVNAFDAEIRRTLDWLAQRSSHWKDEVRRRRREVAEARAELRDCENSADEENTSDCSECEGNLQRARERLGQAEVELRNTERFTRLVQEGVGKYQKQARRFGELLRGQLTKASAILDRKIAHLESYSAVGLTSGSAGIVDSALVPPHLAGGTPPAQGTWIDLGIIDVPLSEIDVSDSRVYGPADFTKMPESEARAELQKFQQVVRPALAAGKKAEFFDELDHAQGLEPASVHGFRHAYNWFYGHDAVTVSRTDSGYTVTNGYHRLYLARSMGWESIPARVFARL